MGEVAKVFESALKDLGDEVCGEEFPEFKNRAKRDMSGKLQGYNDIKAI